MPEITYTITLASDAEPGTGLGTELIDDLVPVDAHGSPFIPASHLRGLAREELRSITSQLGWDPALELLVFGGESPTQRDGIEGCARFGHATLLRNPAQAPLMSIARTALNAHGGALKGSLRTVQAISCGTKFAGALQINPGADTRAVDAAMLALLSIASVGGNRNRGAGKCYIEITSGGKDEAGLTPSTLLRRLHDSRSRELKPTAARSISPGAAPATGSTVLLQLTFEAHDPVCCPVVPLTATTVMRSGFSIPASAVQGALLHLLDQCDHEQASSLFASPGFRAWPLLPIGMPGASVDGIVPVWTSLTHRMSKVAAGVTDLSPVFQDKLIAPYDWSKVPSGAPLKAADGVLLADTQRNKVLLWRAADMPRQHSAHVNLQSDRPGLFSVESMAPLVYRGLVAIPEPLAEPLLAAIRRQPQVAFGRSRATRGGGRLSATRLADDSLSQRTAAEGPIFVVQSPIAVPKSLVADRTTPRSGEEILRHLVESAGFGTCEQAEAIIEFRFGWNRHGAGNRVAETNRLEAEPVIAPGSAFRLAATPNDLKNRLVQGIGVGRERGFGAVLQHPGVASGLYAGMPRIPELRSRDRAGELADSLVKLSGESGLSTSAISQLVRLARGGARPLADFIDRQKQRPTAAWQRWSPLAERLKAIVTDGSISNETRARAFKAWTDAVSAKGGRA
jgi:hypothetical protein